MKSIFLNIASYRDPELLPSITDCINRAKVPERIFFGVHEQNDQHNTSLDKIDNLKYKYIHFKKAKGTGYSRNYINKNLYDGQDYVLQIDSHTRFIQDWDEMYIEDYLQFNEEVILTGFPPQYKLGDLYDDYKIYPSNNAVKPKHITPNYKILSESNPFYTDYIQTYVASGANTFMPKSFIEKSVFELYVDPFADQEIISLAAHLFGYKMFVTRRPKLFHCYANNLKGSDEKFRPLIIDDLKITNFEVNFTLAFKDCKTINTTESWINLIKNQI
jgi:hypothetical protein